MMSEWKACKLGDVVNLKRGYDLPHRERTPGLYPIISSSGVTDYHDEGKVKGPGVVTGRYGTLGQVYYVETDFWPLNTSLYVEDFRGNDPRFISYFLGQLNFGTQNAAGAVPGVNRNHLHALDVRVPPVEMQRRIAGILSAYDELIANSQHRIQILESMARALYREWFVNFRFPGHEKVRRVPSELGKIPEGWAVTRLDSILNLDKGVSYNGAGLTEDGNPMVNLKNIMPGGGFRRDATKPYSGDFKSRHVVTPGDIVLANTDLTQAGNVVASPALIPNIGDRRPILISHHLFAVRLKSSTLKSFVYHLMLEDDFRAFAKGFAIGTTVLGLPREGITHFRFAMPSMALLERFAQEVSPMYQLVDVLANKMELLRRTRDLLLPRLLSGQLALDVDKQ